MYPILSLDGGGVRGVLTARIIEHLEKASPFLADVQLIAGTSTGGILALALAKGLPPSKIVGLYREFSSTIFQSRDWLDGITNLDELVRANYGKEGLQEALESVFDKDETLGDLKKHVVIPAFDLDNQDQISKSGASRRYRNRYWKPKFMHNFEDEGSDRDIRVIDAALRTSAAPTHFPSHQGYVDGGVVDNNPSMSALVKAVKQGAWLGRRRGLIEKVVTYLETLDDPHAAALAEPIRAAMAEAIKLLSIGTGFNPHYIPGDEHDFGYKQWLQDNRLLDMLFDGMLGPPHYMCRELLNGNYFRINPILHEIIKLDAADRVDELIAIADGMDLSKATAWLEGRENRVVG